MQRRAIEDLAALLRDKLAAAEVPAADLRGYVTPRRLTVIADGIAATQPDHTEERRGPRVGAPQPAIDGFLRSAGLSAIERMRNPRHRPRRILFRGRQEVGPAFGRNIAGSDQIRDRRVALAEIDALAGFIVALGTAADLGRLPIRRRDRAIGAGRRAGRPRYSRPPLSGAGQNLRRQRRRSTSKSCSAPTWSLIRTAAGKSSGPISTAGRRNWASPSGPIRRCSTRSPVSPNSRSCSPARSTPIS